ncbi:Wzz/FepE/Etk N-terminal domain-containing protein [Arthrobacter sp. LS16]|uniref:Wzz/FepE/Etk N-terminal domain-containing protein n=1 Tax=Arthrobacter sp. 'calajunan' TaxID=1690248 RepID=UPI003C743AAA
MQENEQQLLLSDLWRRIAYRWKTVCIVATITVIAALAFGLINGTSYSAKTVLTVNPLTTNPFSSATASQQINITTERAILSSGEVARRAAENLGQDASAASLTENASIEAPQGSQVLTVTVVDTDPDRAAAKANALAAAYLEFRAEGAAQVADTYIRAIDKRIESLTQAGNGGSSTDLALSDLINQRNDLSLVAENPGRIIGFAEPAENRSYSGMALYAAAGLAGGLVLGLIAAVVRDRLSRETGNAKRLAQSTGWPVLTLRHPSDLEGMRWIVRSQMGAVQRGTSHNKAMGVLSLGRTQEARIRSLLSRVLDARGQRSHSLSLASVPPEMLDRGWPDASERSSWTGMDAVLIGIPPAVQDTRVALLCDSFLDSIILIVDQATPLAAVNRRLEFFDGIDQESICLVFMQKHKGHSERPSKPGSLEMGVTEKADAL